MTTDTESSILNTLTDHDLVVLAERIEQAKRNYDAYRGHVIECRDAVARSMSEFSEFVPGLGGGIGAFCFLDSELRQEARNAYRTLQDLHAHLNYRLRSTTETLSGDSSASSEP